MKRFNLLITSIFLLLTLATQTVSATTFNDLNNYQKQKYWEYMKTDCESLVKKPKEFKVCEAKALQKAAKDKEPLATYCTDDDGINFMKMGMVKSDLYPKGKLDYSQTLSNGKTYVMEGACGKDKKYYAIQKYCAELGNYQAQDGVCVPINHVPTLMVVMEKTEINEGEKYEIYLYGTDKDGDELKFSADSLPTGSLIDKNAPVPGPLQSGTQHAVFSWTPDYQQAGEYKINFSVTDGKGGQASSPVTVTVKNVNSAPVIEAIPNQTVTILKELKFTVSGTDKDGDILSYSAKNLPNGAKFENQIFSWTPNYGENGEYKVTFTVTDGNLTNSLTVSVLVQAPSAQEILWIYDGNITAIAETPDGGFIAVGNENGNPTAIKLNKYGKAEWQKVVTNSQCNCSLISVMVINDGYVIVGSKFIQGTTSLSQTHGYFLKIDKEGNILTEKTYGPENIIVGNYDKGQFFSYTLSFEKIVNAENGFIIGGNLSTSGYPDLGGGLFAKVDSSGNILWYKVGGATYKYFTDLSAINNGKYVVAGHQVISASWVSWIAVVNETGDIEYESKYENVGWGEIYSVKAVGSGFIAAKFDSITKFDTSGLQIWQKNWEKDYGYGPYDGSSVQFIDISKKNELIYLGRKDAIENGNIVNIPILVKLDLGGNVLSETKFDLKDQYPFVVFKTVSTGGYIVLTGGKIMRIAD